MIGETPNQSTNHIDIQSIARALGGDVSGNTVQAPGPGHSPGDRSLSVTVSLTAPDGFLVFSHSGDDALKCKDYVREKCGLPSFRPTRTLSLVSPKKQKAEAQYTYRDEHGHPYIMVLRRYRNGEKTFSQFRWEDGKWVAGTRGLAAVPYRLPELIASIDRPVFFVEGEKDADRLAARGLLSTTARQGAAPKWRDEQTKWFSGRIVYIIPDNDNPGRSHAHKVARNLATVAADVRVVELPNVPPSGDVSDWLDAGGNIADLIELCEAAPKWAANDNFGPSEFANEHAPRNHNSRLSYLTEDAVAQRFAEISEDRLRYCHSTGAWFEWNGTVWRKNETQLAFHWTRLLSRELSGGHEPKDMKAAQKASFAKAVEKFCQADPIFAVTIDNWDRDDFKLGTPGGTVDLKTGKVSPADRTDGITKQTAVSAADVADCPLWLKFLDETTGSDAELIRFLKQWCGYSLTGDTREHALAFVHGGGGNGKSVFLNTMSYIIHEYAAVASMDTFVASKSDRHPTDLAMLRGARAVTVSETEEGKPWAEARLKQMTGGDSISARFMRQDFFSYKPAFKLTIVGNHKPVLRNVDDAARRRFYIVPFTRKPETPDRQLEVKLKAEGPGILRWMIEGCLDWQVNGLIKPATIAEATEEYFSDQDLFAQWLEQCCDCEAGNHYKWEKSGELFASWSRYSASAGEEPGNTRTFSNNLERKGFAKKRIAGGARAYSGLRLKLRENEQERDSDA